MKISLVAASLLAAPLRLPLYSHGIAAGFPSPADDYIEQALDLNEHLIKHPAATYYARANGNSLSGRGIIDKDLLVIDRSLAPQDGDIVVAALDGDLCCKILDLKHRQLRSAHIDCPPIPIPDESDLLIEGVLIHAIHHVRWP